MLWHRPPRQTCRQLGKKFKLVLPITLRDASSSKWHLIRHSCVNFFVSSRDYDRSVKQVGTVATCISLYNIVGHAWCWPSYAASNTWKRFYIALIDSSLIKNFRKIESKYITKQPGEQVILPFLDWKAVCRCCIGNDGTSQAQRNWYDTQISPFSCEKNYDSLRVARFYKDDERRLLDNSFERNAFFLPWGK